MAPRSVCRATVANHMWQWAGCTPWLKRSRPVSTTNALTYAPFISSMRGPVGAEVQKLKQQAQESKQFMDKQEAEERKLLKIIADADADRLRQKKDLDQVISERDILGTQLVRRNDELALLYEKIKIQQSILNKGEVQYSQRVDDLRLLKMEIKRLRCEKGILNKTVSNVEDLR
ncbi:hypothetical protein ACEWY4_017789 [Coilia grayii]|uniref:Cilia- and flagella-associated protein 58 central coiled coil domain-containing protein n=1 Tax=Coilia grayii TaxID=363190 RepID=A0ABD1JK45_9TELE